MRLVTALFVFLILYFLLFSSGAFPNDPTTADTTGFLLGVGLLVVVSFLVFQYQVWRKGAQTGFQPQEVRAKTLKTPFQVMRESYLKVALISGVSFAAIVLTLEYLGYHDVLVQILDWMASKGDKVVNALVH